jgi:hypothetical protein
MTQQRPRQTRTIPDRVAALDWANIGAALDENGFATSGPLLTPEECAKLAASYDDDAAFRSRVIMQRHGFGSGEYKYFAYPLPPVVEALRTALYPQLATVANHWETVLGRPPNFPSVHAHYLARCHEAGQTKPTPLLLRYRPGDYNCLHQDLYGELHFPLQITILLSNPGTGFTGGAFVLTTQRPRMQSRADVVELSLGEAVMFAVNERPAHGTRGAYRVAMRHGVSRLFSGQRHTLGIIFHDAK